MTQRKGALKPNPPIANKQYGVQDKYDPNDTTWYDTYEEANAALEDANKYVLVEGDKE